MNVIDKITNSEYQDIVEVFHLKKKSDVLFGFCLHHNEQKFIEILLYALGHYPKEKTF